MGPDPLPRLRCRQVSIPVALALAGLLACAAGAEERGSRLVFSCRSASTVTLSDRPCGAGAVVQRVELATPAGPAPGRPPSAAATPPRAATLPRVERRPPTPELRDGGTGCEELGRRLEAIDERMRRGYRAREAGALWTRWREARAALRAAGC